MRINPTTYSREVSMLEKKLGAYHSNHWSGTTCSFSPDKRPNIYNTSIVKGQDISDQEINVTCEVQQLLGNNRVTVLMMV